MSLFTPIATFTLSDQWQFTDVLVGSYFRVVHLTQPLNQDDQLQESSAAIAQADITGFIYTQDDFSHQTDPQSFILEQPDSLEVRKLGLRLLPGQMPWSVRLEALDATLIPGAPGNRIRQSSTFITALIPNDGVAVGLIQLAKSFILHSVLISSLSRVRLYQTDAQRLSDKARSVSTAPTGQHGLIFEAIAAGLVQAQFGVLGSNQETPSSENIPISVVNQSGSAASITVTAIFTALEA